jgi:trehalose 6-phosphate phosphatase
LLGSVNVILHPGLLRALGPLRAAPQVSAVLCDVDGTLAPIVARPSDAELAGGAREALTALRGRMRLVGFVSGRRLRDACDLVGLPGYAYAGNHGMEICHPGGSPELAPGVARHLPAIAAFAAGWDDARARAGGVVLENKGATLSYHARGSGDAERAAGTLTAIAEDARRAGLVPRPGREVMEVRPAVRIDKGTAVRALLARSGARRAVYFGDDWTDADAWRALRELRSEGVLESAVGVCVASPEVPPELHAEADHVVDDPGAVVLALRYLGGLDEPAGGAVAVDAGASGRS